MTATLERNSKKTVSRDPRAVTESDELKRISINLIDPNPRNARKDLDDLAGLAGSITLSELVQPIVVRPMKTGRYELVSGERRWTAAKQAGRTTIEAIVRNLSDQEAMIHSLLENLHRKNLNPIEKARGLEALCDTGKNQREVAEQLGHTVGWVSNVIRLLRLPEAWQRRVATGEVLESQARLLVQYVDDAELMTKIEQDREQNPWAWRIREDWERSIKMLLGKPGEASDEAEPRPPRSAPIAKQERLADRPAAEPCPIAGVITIEDAPAAPDSFTKMPTEILVDDICKRITRLQTVDQLAAVKEAVELRIAFLRRR